MALQITKNNFQLIMSQIDMTYWHDLIANKQVAVQN